MTPLEKIVITAHQIALSGKQPSLALIKRQLGTQFSMPVLIQGLQQYKGLSDLEKQPLSKQIHVQETQRSLDATQTNQSAIEPTSTETHEKMLQLSQDVTQLTQALAVLTKAHQALQNRVDKLEADKKYGK